MKNIIKTPYTGMSKDKLLVCRLNGNRKARIMRYLRRGNLGIVGDCEVCDPFTKKVLTRTSEQFVKDGFEWWTLDIYMFEKYDVELTEEFLSKFA